MLTKDDLHAIEQIVESKTSPIAKDLMDVKRRVRKIEKNFHFVARLYDETDVMLAKREQRIESHLSLPPEN